MKNIQTILLLVALFSITPGCIKETIEGNDNELITTLELHFTAVGSQSTQIFRFDDPDGPGGNAPTQDIVKLAQGTIYNLQVYLLDKTKNPPVDITEEVSEEGESHRIYILPTNLNMLTSTSDLDVDGLPLGINHTVTTEGKSNGKIRVVLRHYADGGKQASDGPDDAKSSTDADIQLSAVIE